MRRTSQQLLGKSCAVHSYPTPAPPPPPSPFTFQKRHKVSWCYQLSFFLLLGTGLELILIVTLNQRWPNIHFSPTREWTCQLLKKIRYSMAGARCFMLASTTNSKLARSPDQRFFRHKLTLITVRLAWSTTSSHPLFRFSLGQLVKPADLGFWGSGFARVSQLCGVAQEQTGYALWVIELIDVSYKTWGIPEKLQCQVLLY